MYHFYSVCYDGFIYGGIACIRFHILFKHHCKHHHDSNRHLRYRRRVGILLHRGRWNLKTTLRCLLVVEEEALLRAKAVAGGAEPLAVGFGDLKLAGSSNSFAEESM